MFAINQYNEGIHAPNVDGVIMGRGTTSDIVYFEQLGRVLSVRGETKEEFERLEKLSLEELMKMCKSKDIPIKDDYTKEELIEKLIAPVVIDLTDNYSFIKELENNLRDRIKSIQNSGLGMTRNIKISDATFDIEIENQDLFEMLMDLKSRLTITWNDYYDLLRAYYEHHGNLLIPMNFKTSNGYEYDKNGINLRRWVSTQRQHFETMPEERKQKLLQLGIVLNVKKTKEEIKNICTMYNINYQKNKTILSHISIQELQSKIEFLQSRNISITNEDGLLHEIFSMSSINMKEKYGISLEEIICEYYIKEKKVSDINMFLEKYLSSIYLDLVYSNYDEKYLNSLDENNFKKVYNLLNNNNFYFIQDIILNYLELFEIEDRYVEYAISDIKEILGNNYVKQIGDNMTYLDIIIKLATVYSEKDNTQYMILMIVFFQIIKLNNLQY